MLWVPQKGRWKYVSNITTTGTSSPGTGVVSNATTLLDGAIVECISAANNVNENWGIFVRITATGASATAAEAKVDILVGGATDDVLIPDLICGYSIASGKGHGYFFPLYVPSGKRIAARINSVRVSITARVEITLFSGGIPPFRVGRKVTTLGTAINAARGIAITPAASGGAATFTQVIASTAEPYFAFIPGFQPATDTTITPAGYVAIQLGEGAATEDKFGPVYLFGKDTNEDVSGPNPSLPAFHDVPSGTRLGLWSSNSGANDAAYDCHIYAVS